MSGTWSGKTQRRYASPDTSWELRDFGDAQHEEFLLTEGEVARYVALVPMLVFVSWGLYDLWRDRARLTEERNWRIRALWHAVLLLVLFGLTRLVMPFLLNLP